MRLRTIIFFLSLSMLMSANNAKAYPAIRNIKGLAVIEDSGHFNIIGSPKEINIDARIIVMPDAEILLDISSTCSQTLYGGHLYRMSHAKTCQEILLDLNRYNEKLTLLKNKNLESFNTVPQKINPLVIEEDPLQLKGKLYRILKRQFQNAGPE